MVCDFFSKSVPPDYTLNIQKTVQMFNINNGAPQEVIIQYHQLLYNLLYTMERLKVSDGSELYSLSQQGARPTQQKFMTNLYRN